MFLDTIQMKQTPLLLLIALVAVYTPVRAVTFDPAVRYSQRIIDANLYDFKANTTAAGFAKYDTEGTEIAAKTSKRGFDYVPGLVAKAVLEAVDWYQDSTFAKPWFYSIQAYGSEFADKAHSGGSLDDLNACKMYFGLADLTAPEAKFADAIRYSSYKTAQSNALKGLSEHNSKYSITTSTISNATALPAPGGGTYDVTGGWWHKSGYNDQLWLDGQYMGPALLSQFVADGQSISGSTEGDWDIIMKQMDITWTYLWDSNKQLLYHAFCADGGTNSTSRSTDWEGLSNTAGSECYHSAEFWGRAEGWYVLALVDILEQMDKAGMPKSDARYQRLLGYLQQSAQGLLRWQDAASGCWYQLLQYKDTTITGYKVGSTEVSTKSATNYLESSASSIFTAVLLKGMRLGYLDKSTYEAAAKKAYQGLVEQFVTTGDKLIYCCKSAGLGGKSNTDNKSRDGSAAYYLLGSDTPKTIDYTEGKVLGAFILAAVEYERAYMPLQQPETPDPNAPVSACRCLKLVI